MLGLSPLLLFFWIESSVRSAPPPAAATDTGPASGWAPYQGDLSWDDILDIVARGQFERFSRTDAVCQDYIRWRADMPRLYAGVPDFIRIEVLGFPYRMDAMGRKVLRRNDFPYATRPEEKIQHLVLWYLGEKEMEVDQAVGFLKTEMPGYEFIIHHFQVFARPCKE
ncbi:hypothetical protein HDU96_005071 [Phlyctochytrium bullatum]|nr:hypothetical protein HDU96_005071 [Phlyctochytrium bullatum]